LPGGTLQEKVEKPRIPKIFIECMLSAKKLGASNKWDRESLCWKKICTGRVIKTQCAKSHWCSSYSDGILPEYGRGAVVWGDGEDGVEEHLCRWNKKASVQRIKNS
jgi:hypothetical protein